MISECLDKDNIKKVEISSYVNKNKNIAHIIGINKIYSYIMDNISNYQNIPYYSKPNFVTLLNNFLLSINEHELKETIINSSYGNNNEYNSSISKGITEKVFSTIAEFYNNIIYNYNNQNKEELNIVFDIIENIIDYEIDNKESSKISDNLCLSKPKSSIVLFNKYFVNKKTFIAVCYILMYSISRTIIYKSILIINKYLFYNKAYSKIIIDNDNFNSNKHNLQQTKACIDNNYNLIENDDLSSNNFFKSLKCIFMLNYEYLLLDFQIKVNEAKKKKSLSLANYLIKNIFTLIVDFIFDRISNKNFHLIEEYINTDFNLYLNAILILVKSNRIDMLYANDILSCIRHLLLENSICRKLVVDNILHNSTFIKVLLHCITSKTICAKLSSEILIIIISEIKKNNNIYDNLSNDSNNNIIGYFINNYFLEHNTTDILSNVLISNNNNIIESSSNIDTLIALIDDLSYN